MSGERLPSTVPGPAPEPVGDPRLPDRLLMGLVEAVNTLDMDIGVTLHVAGVVISGTLISGRKFFHHIAQALREAAARHDAQAAEGLAEGFTAVADSYRLWAEHERQSDSNDDQDAIRPLTLYIHLRDAAVYAPGGPPLPGMLWRGRLAHVSGWSLGVLT